MRACTRAALVLLACATVACSSDGGGKTRSIAVEIGTLKSPGRLVIPATETKPPVVVMMGGSGPADMDDSVGANKPFRDIAEGLAKQGIASLRYAKSNARALLNPRFTAFDEYQPDAIAAVQLLSKRHDVDTSRIVLLGHSLGGTLAPRVAATEPRLAGVILMAPAAEDLGDATVRQVEYINSLGLVANPDAQLAAATAFAREIHDPHLQPDSRIASPIAGGATGAYFLDLRAYDAPATAKALAKPILLLQGERDYQVTIAESFTKWAAALAGRTDVTLLRYPNANHLFIDGTGPASPADYETAGHVSSGVVKDIADWVKAR